MKTNIDLDSYLQHDEKRLKKLSVDSPLGAFFGFSLDGKIRFAISSTIEPCKFESTKNILTSYAKDSLGIYWSYFDLCDNCQKMVFLSFVRNLIDSVLYCVTENQALLSLKKRYATWKMLFKKVPTSGISSEEIQGAYGELFFLKHIMIPKYGIECAVRSWSGPDKKSKDFSVNNKWFEIKTIGANASTVRISSLSQLSSNEIGKLVVIKVESMSEEYRSEDSCIAVLFEDIRKSINDEAVEELFFNKVSATGVIASDDAMNKRFCVKDICKYIVDEKFPKITDATKPFDEICAVEYELSLGALRKYMEV